jgi:cytoskeletal protein RodZ
METANECHLTMNLNDDGIGNTLKRMRELREFSKEEVAHQLRLQTSMIDLLESDNFPGNLPEIFARGHLKSYARLLQFSDDDVKKMLTSFEVKDNYSAIAHYSTTLIANHSSRFTYFLTGFAILIMITLLLMWLEPSFYPIIKQWFPQ